jgi:heme-degrading monooxygenase HmoA
MVQFVWEYIVLPEKAREFERAYAGSGAWAELFRKNPGYRGTQLLRDAENLLRYLTIDRWDSVASHQAMRERFAKDYAEMDRACEDFTETERSVGVFEEE